MKGGLNNRGNPGFTIVEVIIFLAVSSAMLLSAITLVDGKQNNTEFTQSINLVQEQIQQTADDVINGYYTSVNNFICTATPTNPNVTIALGSQSQGSNSGCIFLGKALQFGVSAGSNQDYYTYTIVGSQCSNGSACTNLSTATQSNSIANVLPTVLCTYVGGQCNSSFDASIKQTLENGLNVTKMQAWVGGSASDIGAFAVTETLASSSGNAGSAQSLNLYAISGTNINDETESNAVSYLNNSGDWTTPDKITICFSSASTNQSGLITVGGTNSQVSVTLTIYGDLTC